MQWIKIRIPDKEQSARALVEMGRRGRIDCYADHVYMVPEPALQLLKDLNITYVELGRGGFDYALKTYQDTLAAHAQGRNGTPRRIRAVYRDGAFVPHEPCSLPDGAEVELLVEQPSLSPPPVQDPAERARILERVTQSMRQNPIPPEAPRLGREDLHERR